MITEAYLANIQIHKSSRITFVPGVNVIIGESHQGKTSIIRALKWVLRNDGTGQGLVSDGEKSCFTAVTLQSEEVITRAWSKTENSYSLISPSSKKVDFLSFGKSVPEPIANLINMSDVNWQFQLDAPGYLLAVSGGKLAEIINASCRLDVIDTMTRNIGRMKRDTDRDLKTAKGNLEEAQDTLRKFSGIEDLIERRDQLSKQDQELNDLAILLEDLQSIVDDLAEVGKRIKAGKKWEPIFKRAALLEEMKAERELLHQERREILLLTTSIDGKDSDIKVYKERLVELKERWNRERPDICPLCEQEWPNEV